MHKKQSTDISTFPSLSYYNISSGGAIQIVIDVETLSDFPDINNIDDFTRSLLDIEELREIPALCTVEVVLTTGGNLLIVFNSRKNARFCNNGAQVSFSKYTTSKPLTDQHTP